MAVTGCTSYDWYSELKTETIRKPIVIKPKVKKPVKEKVGLLLNIKK